MYRNNKQNLEYNTTKQTIMLTVGGWDKSSGKAMK